VNNHGVVHPLCAATDQSTKTNTTHQVHEGFPILTRKRVVEPPIELLPKQVSQEGVQRKQFALPSVSSSFGHVILQLETVIHNVSHNTSVVFAVSLVFQVTVGVGSRILPQTVAGGISVWNANAVFGVVLVRISRVVGPLGKAAKERTVFQAVRKHLKVVEKGGVIEQLFTLVLRVLRGQVPCQVGHDAVPFGVVGEGRVRKVTAVYQEQPQSRKLHLVAMSVEQSKLLHRLLPGVGLMINTALLSADGRRYSTMTYGIDPLRTFVTASLARLSIDRTFGTY